MIRRAGSLPFDVTRNAAPAGASERRDHLPTHPRSGYTPPTSYLAFFEQYLFADPGALVTPLAFLTILSAFELAAGIALLAGAFVRAISLTFAFMFWTFVLVLPVVTAPGFEADAPSYLSPAYLVAIGKLFFFGGGKAFRPSGLVRAPMRSILGHAQRA